LQCPARNSARFSQKWTVRFSERVCAPNFVWADPHSRVGAQLRPPLARLGAAQASSKQATVKTRQRREWG
jgi:hypothetical protein